MMMLKLLKPIVTLGAIGYLPASGTCASVFTVLVLLCIKPFCTVNYLSVILFLIAAFLIVHFILPEFRDSDPHEIVIDEVAGTLLCCFNLPIAWIIFTFLLFRYFDIFKRPFIWRVEAFQGAFGLMADDLLAALFSLTITKFLILCFEKC